MRLALAAIAVVCVVAAPAAAGPAGTIHPPSVLAKQLRALHEKTSVPILLPGSLPWTGPAKLYPDGWGDRKSWGLLLAAAPRCGSATACFVASFEGRRGATLPLRSNLTLPGGQNAVYKPITCGASCSPASLWFVHQGVLHSWQLKEPPAGGKRALARVAAAAIAAGPR